MTERLQRRERWAQALAAGRQDEIDTAFRAGGAASPSVVWNPRLEDLATEPCRFLLQHWHKLRGAHDLPPAASIEPAAMRPALGYVLLLDVIEAGEDFRYRLYGSLVTSVSDHDMTGRRMSEHSASDYVVDFAVACGRAGMRRRLPLYTLRFPARTEYTRAWERLQLPLSGPDGCVTRLLVGNVPTDRAGEVLRPRF